MSHIVMYTKLKPADTELKVKQHQEGGHGTYAHERSWACS